MVPRNNAHGRNDQGGAMDERIAEIKNILTQNYEQTHKLLSSLTPQDLAKTAANGWTVAQLAGHVASAPGGAVWLTSRLRNGRGANVPAFLSWVPALRNWLGTRKMKQASQPELLATAESAHHRLQACVDGLQEGELDRGGIIWGMGQRTVYEFLSQNVASHAEEHRQEIRAAIGTPAAV
jgi:hypothetical protein